MKSQEIVDLLIGYKGGDYEFTFVEKRGMDHLFQVEGPDSETAAALAKQLIRETDFGKVLYFSVKTLAE
jgi:hypothetical protein